MTPDNGLSSGGQMDPAMAAMRLRARLKACRKSAGLTQQFVAERLYWSPSKVIRIEAGKVGVTIPDARSLLAEYGVGGEEFAEIEALAVAARSTLSAANKNKYVGIIQPQTLSLARLERNASVLSSFQPSFIPGLLQTEAYARTVLRFIRGSNDEERIDTIIEFRKERQDALLTAGVPLMQFIVDESVIRRHVGGREVMVQQLRRILDLMDRGIIDFRVVPFAEGMYRGLRVPYLVLEFPPEAERGPDDEVLYLEYPDGERIIRANEPVLVSGDEPTSPSTYLEIFAELGRRWHPDQARFILNHELDAIRGTPLGPPARLVDLRPTEAPPQPRVVDENDQALDQE